MDLFQRPNHLNQPLPSYETVGVKTSEWEDNTNVSIVVALEPAIKENWIRLEIQTRSLSKWTNESKNRLQARSHRGSKYLNFVMLLKI